MTPCSGVGCDTLIVGTDSGFGNLITGLLDGGSLNVDIQPTVPLSLDNYNLIIALGDHDYEAGVEMDLLKSFADAGGKILVVAQDETFTNRILTCVEPSMSLAYFSAGSCSNNADITTPDFVLNACMNGYYHANPSHISGGAMTIMRSDPLGGTSYTRQLIVSNGTGDDSTVVALGDENGLSDACALDAPSLTNNMFFYENIAHWAAGTVNDCGVTSSSSSSSVSSNDSSSSDISSSLSSSSEQSSSSESSFAASSAASTSASSEGSESSESSSVVTTVQECGNGIPQEVVPNVSCANASCAIGSCKNGSCVEDCDDPLNLHNNCRSNCTWATPGGPSASPPSPPTSSSGAGCTAPYQFCYAVDPNCETVDANGVLYPYCGSVTDNVCAPGEQPDFLPGATATCTPQGGRCYRCGSTDPTPTCPTGSQAITPAVSKKCPGGMCYGCQAVSTSSESSSSRYSLGVICFRSTDQTNLGWFPDADSCKALGPGTHEIVITPSKSPRYNGDPLDDKICFKAAYLYNADKGCYEVVPQTEPPTLPTQPPPGYSACGSKSSSSSGGASS